MPGELKPEHGYHRACYQDFTICIDRLKSSTDDSETIQQTRTSGVSSTASGKMILKPDYSLIL